MAVGTETHVTRRRFVYGTNAALQVVVLAVVVVFAIWLAQHYKRQTDLTRSGVNSLSQRTEKLLAKLPDDITITALYTVLSEYDELAQKRSDRVRDLIALYEAAGHGHVTARLVDPMKNQAQLKAMLQRLREKPAYAKQALAYQKALEGFPAINEQIRALIDEQAVGVSELLQRDPNLASSQLPNIQRKLEQLSTLSVETAQTLQELTGAEIPQYKTAVETARSLLETAIGWMKSVEQWLATATLPPDAQQFFQTALDNYAPLREQAKTYLKNSKDLPELELEEIASELDRWANAPPVLVETAEEAVVVPFNEVWPFQMNRSAPAAPDGDRRQFKGEQAISSAILRLTQKEKTAVIFTRYGGPSPIVPDFSQINTLRQMPRAPYQGLNSVLGQENFITEDWDVATQKTPPKVEAAARTVYIVFPPEPPPPMNPRQPSPQPGISEQDVSTILDAVGESGMAIFLAGWRPPNAPMPGMGGMATYEFADYLRSNWGIDVKYNYLTLSFMPNPEKPGLYAPRYQQPILRDKEIRLTDQPIAKPLQALPAGLAAVCPLEIETDALPEGVEVRPILETAESSDIWAFSDLQRIQSDLDQNRGTKRYDDDLPSPFPVAVAASNADGKRLVVFASAQFPADMFAEAQSYALTANGLVSYPIYPANTDLFVNALHWLTQEADRIAVGAQGGELPRLDQLKQGPGLYFWNIFLVGIWPGLVLVIGGGVWLFRRR